MMAGTQTGAMLLTSEQMMLRRRYCVRGGGVPAAPVSDWVFPAVAAARMVGVCGVVRDAVLGSGVTEDVVFHVLRGGRNKNPAT